MSGNAAGIATGYGALLGRKAAVAGLLLAAVVLLALAALAVGSYPLSPGDVLAALAGRADGVTAHIIGNIRLPRAVAAVVAGASLGIAGAVMQNVIRNPLASPFTLGVSQGAAFGAALAIVSLGGSAAKGLATTMQAWLTALSAFAGALATVAAILMLSALRRLAPATLILAGVAMSALFGAATMFLQYFSTDSQLAATVFWTFGDLGRAGWRDILLMTAALAPGLAYFLWNSWGYNALEWGDETAGGLGVSVGRLRLGSLAASALVAAVTVACLGVIGFVGLVAPHIMRFFVGDDHRFLLPCSALCGSMLLLAADILSRLLLAPVVVPVGIVTTFAGAPLLLYLLMKGRKVP
ncbi:MAG TPA: iron ABC transporter permease [Syntrophales bacterium]|nr:iron ABC transporter permease [Syntrophales bacterium]